MTSSHSNSSCTRKQGFILTVSILALSAVGLDSAYAQSVDVGADRDVDEIVVTATKRGEVNEFDVPIALEVFSGAEIASSGVTDLNDIALISPSVNVASASAYASPFIRGIGSLTSGPNIYGSVAFYIDGVYQPNQIAMNTGGGTIENAESVQVLKGPQGTLYGRNATGGAILVETFTPTPGQELEGFLQGELAEFGTRNVQGRASFGLGDKAAASFNFSVHDADGFVENRGVGNNFDDEDGFLIGGKLALAPTDRLSLVLSGTHHEDRESFVSGMQVGQSDNFAALPGLNNPQTLWAGTVSQIITGGVLANGGTQADADAAVGAAFPTILGLASGISFFDEFGVSADNNGPSGFENGVHDPNGSPLPSKGEYISSNLSLKGTLEFDAFNLVSISGYIDTSERNVIDIFRANPTSLPDLSVLGLPAVLNQGNIGFSQPVDGQAFSQELYAVSTSGPFEWIAGIYYFDHQSEHTVSSDVFGTSTAIVQNEVTTESISGFAEVTYPLSEALSVTGGLRYTDEEYVLNDQISGAPFPNVGTLTRNDDKLTYNAKLTYDTGDFLTYAGITTGFKSGSLNPTSPGAGQVAPESLTSYEAGFKANVGNGIRLSGAAFIYDFENIQANVVSTINGGVGFIVDGVEADIKGVEFSVNAPLTSELNLFANATLLDHEYTTDAVIQGTGEIQAINGNKLAQTADFAASFGMNYDKSLSSGAEIKARANATYNSGFWGDQLNINGSGGDDDDGFFVLNASADYVMPSGNISLGVFVNNLLDEEYFIGSFNVGNGLSQIAAPGRARQFGARARYNF